MNDQTTSQDQVIVAMLESLPTRLDRQYRRSEIETALAENDSEWSQAWPHIRTVNKPKKGTYDLTPLFDLFRSSTQSDSPAANAVSMTDDMVYVPRVDGTYIPWGHSADIKAIVESRQFFPTYIMGLSGNGKTMMVEQSAAAAGRQIVRAQINPETDEDDLIGGFRLVNGETVFCDGPAITAMKTGAILLLDEIDRGSNRLMCLQGILEGKPVLIKKTGEVVSPAPGFNIIATANTKGRGSDDGRYSAASMIDEAFLERFSITFVQPYATEAVEAKIIKRHMEKFNCYNEGIVYRLKRWATEIRKTYADGGIDEVVATRRVCHAIQTFSIFGDIDKAIDLTLNRFDEDTHQALFDLWKAIRDPDEEKRIQAEKEAEAQKRAEEQVRRQQEKMKKVNEKLDKELKMSDEDKKQLGDILKDAIK